MLRHIDSFDWAPTTGDSALLIDRYDLVDADVVIDDSGLYTPWGNGVTATSATQRLRKVIAATPTPITGFHFNPITLTARTICRFLSAGVVHGVLRISADGRIQAYKADAVTLIAQSSAGVLVAGTTYWIEAKYHVSADLDLGFVVVGVDDVSVISQRAATKTATAVTCDAIELVLDANTVAGDWVIKDTSGTTHNNFGGEAFVELGVLQSGMYSDPSSFAYQWTNSNATMVDNTDYINEVPTTAPEDDAQYVSSPASSNKRDVHRVELPMLNGVLAETIPVTAIGVLYRARRTAAGSETFITDHYHAPSMSEATGDTLTVASTSYLYKQALLARAANTAPWTEDLYASSEFGYLTP